MKQFVITVTGVACLEDAFSFYCNQAHTDFGRDICEIVVQRGFKRMLLCRPSVSDHIKERLKRMGIHSPNEFVWMGSDGNGNNGNSYIIYGVVPDGNNTKKRSN